MKNAAVTAMALVVSMTAAALDSRSYVQEGIVAQWDGIENAGRGVHDASAANWTDLTGCGHNLTLSSGASFAENAFVFPENAHGICASFANSTAVGGGDYASWDLAYTETSRAVAVPFIFGFGNWKGLCLYTSKNMLQTNNGKGWTLPADDLTLNEMHTVFADYGKAASMTATACVFDGVSLSQSGSSDNWTQKTSGLGYANNSNWSFHGGLHALRLYNRSLTPAEVGLNRAIDLVRFGGKTQAEVALPEGYSWTDAGTGVLVEDAISFSSSNGGMVSAVGAEPAASGCFAKEANTSVTLRAVPAEGYAFHRWSGDTSAIVDGNAFSAEIGVAAARRISLTAEFGAPGGTLDEDKNYVGMGEGTFLSSSVVDLNGHRLYIDGTALNGVAFIDSSTGEPGELHVVVGDGDKVSPEALNLNGNIKLVKEGAGELEMRPSGLPVKCAQGRLVIGGKRPIHRWSFTDGSLADSAGGSTATEVTANSGTISYADNAVTFSGGKYCYLNLGTDVIPSSGDVTIELWGRRNEASHQWASMFSIGVNGNNNDSLRMAWSNAGAGDGASDMVYLKSNGDVFFRSNTMTPYTVGTFYHISMRIVQNSDGSAVFTWSKRNAATGAIEKTYTDTVPSSRGWSLARYAGNPFVLNHGYDNDDEAATYDEVRIWDCALSDDDLTANAVAGPDAFPQTVVEAPELLHRWSFTDGSLADSAGGSTATEVTANSGTISYADNAVTFSGGKYCYLNLGTDVIPSSGDVTIELWGRRNEASHQWASMFSIGVNGNNNDSLRMAWSNAGAGDGASDMVYLKSNGDVFFRSNTMTPYTVGTFYHISMRIVQNSDGSAVFTWSKRNAATGAIEKTYTDTVPSSRGWSLARYAGNPFVLNHGYDNDDEAATYDEVRIWKGALTDEQLSLNARLGPDKAVAFSGDGRCGLVEIAAGATLSTPSDGVECRRLAGAGTLAAQSSLVVETLDIAGDDAGSFTVDGTLKVAGDWIISCGSARRSDRVVGAGTLDLTEAILAPDYAQDAAGPHLIAEGVGIVGREQMAVSGKYLLEFADGRLYIKRQGFAVFVR